MFNIWQVLALIGGGVLLAVLCVVVGGWLVFKSKMAGPGTPFIGRPPKGEVFTIPSAEDAEDFPEETAEKSVLARTEAFLARLSGGNKS